MNLVWWGHLSNNRRRVIFANQDKLGLRLLAPRDSRAGGQAGGQTVDGTVSWTRLVGSLGLLRAELLTDI